LHPFPTKIDAMLKRRRLAQTPYNMRLLLRFLSKCLSRRAFGVAA
jgi:hypothetical protein